MEVIKRKHREYYYEQSKKLYYITAATGSQHVHQQLQFVIDPDLLSVAPARQTVASCFLSQFHLNEQLYIKRMAQTTIGEGNDAWLSCDHTFASIGGSTIIPT